MSSPINSLPWWNHYFEEQWERNQGRDQTRHFMAELLHNLPSSEYRWIASGRRTILDWGCAMGDGVDVLQTGFPSSEVCGLDFSRTAIEKAKAAYPQHRFVLADNGEIPLNYDVIFTSNCLEHYSHPLEIAARHVERSRFLYILMVPFEEPEPVDETHIYRFSLQSFPDQINAFRKLSLIVFRPLPRYWNAPQAIVCYASPDYMR